MVNVKGRVRVHTGEARSRSRRPPPIESRHQHFRLERQGALVAVNTLFYYDPKVLPFLDGLVGRGVRAGGNGPGRSARPDDRLAQSWPSGAAHALGRGGQGPQGATCADRRPLTPCQCKTSHGWKKSSWRKRYGR